MAIILLSASHILMAGTESSVHMFRMHMMAPEEGASLLKIASRLRSQAGESARHLRKPRQIGWNCAHLNAGGLSKGRSDRIQWLQRCEDDNLVSRMRGRGD
jgi:hypothetical protein